MSDLPLRPSARPASPAVTWLGALVLTTGFIVLLWVLEVLDALAGNPLDQYGVRPRSDEGLVGIAVAPVLHGGFDHLAANTVPTLVLGFLALMSGLARGLAATAIIWVVAGLGVWTVGATNSVHIGASSLVFGWLVYLILRGIFNRRIGQILLGAAVLLVYGGMLLGVLPGQPGISWEGHFFGAVGGALAAVLLQQRRPVSRG